MTPKEKARNLVIKYRLIEFDKTEDTRLMISIADAKECALIIVDEILSLSKIAAFRRDEVYMELEYWQEVKQEIELL